jgi:hypothetical protein
MAQKDACMTFNKKICSLVLVKMTPEQSVKQLQFSKLDEAPM